MRRYLVPLAVFCALPAAVAKDPPKFDFALKSLDGQRVRLSDHRGKVVVLNFWATWCVPCNAELPMLVEAEKQYRGRGVVFIAVSLDGAKTKAEIPGFVAKYGVTFPVWAGGSTDELDKLSMGPAVPATAFLDEEGHILARVWGQMRETEMKERLEWLTGPRTSPAPQALVKHLQ